MKRSACTLCAILPAMLLTLGAVDSFASEGGTTHYNPGTLATLIDNAPSQGGWVLEPMYLHYQADVEVSKQIPVAGLTTSGLSAKADAITFGGLHTLDQKVFGANYTFGAYVPYIWLEVDAKVEADLGAKYRSDTEQGLGDITFIPAMFAWKNGRFQYNTGLNVYAPTGDYEMGRLANPGMNYWSFNPWAGVNYTNEVLNLNAALNGGIFFNTENPDTDYSSGAYTHLEASVQKLFVLGKGLITIGAEAFWCEQVEADSGQSERLGDFKGRTTGVGPVLGYMLPMDGKNLVFELRWLTELDVKNRLSGDYIWLKAVYQF